MNSKFLLFPLLSLCALWSSLPASAQKGAAKAPEGGRKHIYKTVGEVQLPLYVYSPVLRKSPGELPAIVFFFGGGWKAGSPTQFEEHCKYLAGRGMVAVTVEYRVTSQDQGHGFFNFGRAGGRYYRLTLAEMDKFLISLGYLKGKAKETSPAR